MMPAMPRSANGEHIGPSYHELLLALVEGERVALDIGSDWPSVPSEVRFPLLKWAHDAHRLLDQCELDLAAPNTEEPG